MFRKYYGQCPKCTPDTIRLIVTKNGLCQQHNHEMRNIGKMPKAPKQKAIVRKEANYGQCSKCEPGTKQLLVVKDLCKYHNEERKNKSKPQKASKPKKAVQKKIRYGQCKLCPENTSSILVVKHFCHYHNEQKKKEEKSRRVVKLINRSEKKKSVKKLKEELDAVFSLFIRHRDSKNGMNNCFTCSKPFLIKDLQDGHYESRRFLALRYSEVNNHPQCFDCNIRKKGNYTVYALKMMEKYGKEHLDMLSIKKHNIIHWSAFEYQLMIEEYTIKLKNLKQTL